MTLPTGERIEKDEHLTNDEAIAKVRKLLPSFSAAMFVTGLSRRTHPHSRPLALQGDPSIFGGTLFFFADNRSPKIHELSADPTVSLFFQNDADSCYMQLDGSAAVDHDRPRMRELYTPVLRTWFPEGLDDPNLTWEQKREKIREMDSRLTPSQVRQGVQIEFKQQARERNAEMHQFLQMSPEEQAAYLKKRDEEWKQRRQQRASHDRSPQRGAAQRERDRIGADGRHEEESDQRSIFVDADPTTGAARDL